MNSLELLKKQLFSDSSSVLYLNKNINSTVLKKFKKSKYHKDVDFLIQYNVSISKDVRLPVEAPIFTPFVRRKNDEQSTLYSVDGPLQRMHADIADIRFLKPNATEPNYILVVVDLFSSFTYLIPLKNRSKLNKGVEQFYDTIVKDRNALKKRNRSPDDPPPMYIQTDMEFNRIDINLLNDQYNVEMYSSKMNSGHAFAAEQKIRELKKLLTIQSRTLTGKRNLHQNLRDASTQINLTTNAKYNVKPGIVQEKTIKNGALEAVYNHYRLKKVQKNHGRIRRYEGVILNSRINQLRELHIGDLVYVEAGRIKKQDQPSALTKKTTDLKPHYNTKNVYTVINKWVHRKTGEFKHFFYRVSPVDVTSKNISHRLARDELFAIVNNTSY